MYKLIIAGNYRQAKEYASEHKLNPREWVFIDHEDKLRGLRNVEIIRTGEYWSNPINTSDYLRIIENETSEKVG